MNSPKPMRRRLIPLAVCATMILTRDARSAMTAVWSKTFDGTGGYPNDVFLGSPAIGSDGTIYIAGGFPDSGNSNQRRLYALNGSNGAILTGWPVYLGARITGGNGRADDKGIESSAAIGPDGSLYIGSWNTNVFKINPSTRAITTWTPNTGNSEPRGILRSAPIVANGYVYCWMSGDPAAASPHPHLVILNASTMAYVGSWLDNTVYGEAIASPALGRDKKIYVCTHEYTDKNNAFSHIYAINVTDPAHPAGLWGYPAGCLGTIVASPVIAADGKIYVCTRDGAMGGGTAHVPVIICFDPASATPQTPIWTCTTGGFRPIDGTPAIGRIGDLYVPNDLNNSTSLSAMDPSAQTDGNDYVPEWDFSLTVEKFDSGPVVAADETVFAKSILEASPHTATFREISNGADVADATVGNDTLAWHLHPDDGAGIDAVFSSPAIAVNGKIYVATAGSDNGATPPIPTGGGTISCFDTGTSAPGFWPNYRGNQYNTGNAQDNKWTTNSVISASIQQLLSYPYSGAASANAVNNGGKTVGSRFNGSWSAAGSWTVTSQYPSSMSGLSGYPVYAAYGINDTQQAAGSDFDQYGLPHHALFWSTLSATPIDLTPTGFSISQGYAIDPIARIAGAAKQSSSPNAWHAIRWDSGDPANAKDLGTLKSALGAYSYAYGINAHGTVVGKSQTDSPGHYFAFSMPSTRNSLLPTDNLEPTSSLDNASYAVNSAGQIVGGYVLSTSPYTEHACIWTRDNNGVVKRKDLGTLGGISSRALAINNRGQVVGWAYRMDGTQSAFIWAPGWSDMRDLHTLLSGTDQTTWTTLNGGYGISDDGVVVGAGRRSGSSFDDGFAIKPKP